MEEPDDAGEHPELPALGHEDGEDAHARIGDDADEDEKVVVHFGGELPEDDGGGKGDDLR